jgi:Spy/CpxP family protein refolding chaperone
MKPSVKGALLLLLAFLLGTAVGVLGFGLYQGRGGWWRPPRDPAQFQQFVLKRLTKELDLRSDQRQQVEVILREAGQEFARLREEFGPRVREIRTSSRQKIRAILSPEQQAKLEALEKEWGRHEERRQGGALPPEGKESKRP